MTTFIAFQISDIPAIHLPHCLPYPSKHNMVKLPVNPEPPKKMPEAMASFFANWKTLSTLCENREPSSACALNALLEDTVSLRIPDEMEQTIGSIPTLQS